MTLADLRRLATRKQSKIRFRLGNGMECVVSEDGVARVPALNSVPEFNLEQELAGATAFVVEGVTMGRAAVAAMVVDSRGGAVASDEHEEE